MSTQGSLPGVTMEKSHPTEMAAEIVAAFVSNNSVPRSELSALFETVHAAVKRLAEGGAVAPAVSSRPRRRCRSASPSRRIISSAWTTAASSNRCGGTCRPLGMTPDQYRAKWNLPDDYPMVASNYAAQRSELAKKIGLGQLRKKAVPAPPSLPPASVSKRKAARPRKATA